MVLYIQRSSLEIAEALRQVRREKPLDEILGDEVDVRREHKLVLEDALVNL